MRVKPSSVALLAASMAVLLAATCPDPAFAAAKKGGGNVRKQQVPDDVMYRCKDAKGQSYAGQNIPAECMDADVDVIDAQGRIVRVIPGRAALENAEAQKAAEEALKAAQQRDRTLLATYLSVADIERLRDSRLEQLEQQARVTQQYIVNLKERESRLAQDVQRFKPYSSSPKAPPLPDHVAEDIVNTVNGLQVYQQELVKNTTEQEKLRSEFAADIARFKELKGIK